VGTLLLMTAKLSKEDPDSAAVFQKTEVAGIEVNGSNAVASLLAEDTRECEGSLLFCDVWATESDGERKGVAEFKIELKQSVSHELGATIPIYTTEPGVGGVFVPVPVGQPDGRILLRRMMRWFMQTFRQVVVEVAQECLSPERLLMGQIQWYSHCCWTSVEFKSFLFLVGCDGGR
jgi:hypothetical protein